MSKKQIESDIDVIIAKDEKRHLFFKKVGKVIGFAASIVSLPIPISSYCKYCNIVWNWFF